MAVFAASEYTSAPASPSQWQLYYNPDDDNLYIQMLPPTTLGQANIVTPGGAVRASNVVTLTTTAVHGLSVGMEIVVAGVSDATFAGSFIVAEVPSTTTVKYYQVGANATADGGTIDPAYPKWQAITTGREVRDDVRPTDTLTRAKYLGRDYNTHLDEGISWLRENFADQFTDFVASDFGVIFAKYVAAGLDTLSWYMDREVTEWYWSFLRLRARAEYLARMSAYKPRPATACTSVMTLTFTEGPYAFDFTIQPRFQFQGPNGLIFETTQAVPVAAGETSVSGVAVTQGRTIEEDFVSNGEANQRPSLSELDENEHIALGSEEIYVNNVLWTVVDFLPFDRLNQLEIMYESVPPLLIFGNGVMGNIPEQGAPILARYRVTKGKLGKAATVNTIKTVVSDLVVNNQTIPMTVTNTTGAGGGDDPESLDSIKVNAPAYFLTADRGVTRQDITTLASTYADGTYGTVSMAKANIVRGIEEDLALQMKIQAVSGLATNLDTYLDTIATQASAIDTAVAAIESDRVTLAAEVTSANGHLADAESQLEDAKAALEQLPYQDILGSGDGTTVDFLGYLKQLPVYAGSVVIITSGAQSILDSGNDGDASTAGRFSAASANFTGKVGYPIDIGGQIRQITRVISGTEVAYSGTVLSGTTLAWQLYDLTIFGVDDGSGVITGTGIGSGSTVDYSTGQVQLKFDAALPYGAYIIGQYGYEDSGVAGNRIDDAITDVGEAEANLTTLGDGLSDLGDIATQTAAISAATTVIDGQITLALTIPADIESALDDLEEYLDEHLSDECRANVVSVQALVVDENGFYVAPTQALLTALADYLGTKNVVPTTISTVSGYYNVVAVDMTFRIKITPPYIFSEVSPRLSAKIDDLLRGRAYDEDLFRSDYYNITVPDQSTGEGGTEGISYANITITGTSFPDEANTGTAPSADSDGNLIVSDKQIITKGTITIEEIS